MRIYRTEDGENPIQANQESFDLKSIILDSRGCMKIRNVKLDRRLSDLSIYIFF